MRYGLMLLLLSVATSASSAHDIIPSADRLAHEQMLVLDAHLDTPAHFERPGWNFDEWHEYEWDHTQTDIARMQAGGLDGGFFVIYTPQGQLTPQGFANARDHALGRATAIQRIVNQNRNKLEFATTAADAERIHNAGRRIVYQSIENSYPLGEDLGLLASFYKLGVRMAGPVHSKNNQFADSATDLPHWNGLSPLGRQWVAEINRLGMVIDASHSSDAALDQLLALSKTPIILSHSGPKAIHDHPRNIDDERMRRLARAGGVMQMNSLFLAHQNWSDERTALEARQARWLDLTLAERQQLVADKTALDARDPFTAANFDTFMRSLLHAIKVMGVDHVGLGADWDGGGGVDGMEDVSQLPKITARLRKHGYSDSDIEKIWSGNVLRLLKQAEIYSASSAALTD